MLVLTRRIDEAILIGHDVVVRVLGVDKNGQVKLGIDAPKRLRILREELVREISDANRQALAEQAQLASLDFLNRLVMPKPRDETPGSDDEESP